MTCKQKPNKKQEEEKLSREFFHSEGGHKGVDCSKLPLSPWIIKKNKQMSLRCFCGGQEEGVKNQSPLSGAEWGGNKETIYWWSHRDWSPKAFSTIARRKMLRFLCLASLSPWGIRINHSTRLENRSVWAKYEQRVLKFKEAHGCGNEMQSKVIAVNEDFSS